MAMIDSSSQRLPTVKLLQPDSPAASRIPQEIADSIIDHFTLADNRDDLHNVALVSPMWLHSARRQIFSVIVVSEAASRDGGPPHTLDVFRHRLDTMPNLKYNVLHLHLRNSHLDTHIVRNVVEQLPLLKSLHLISVHLEVRSTHLLNDIKSCGRDIALLELSGIVVSSSRPLPQIVGMFTSISKLLLGSVTYSLRAPRPVHRTSRNQDSGIGVPVKTLLLLANGSDEDLYQRLREVLDVSQARSLSLRWSRTIGASCTGVISSVSKTLRRLHVDLNGDLDLRDWMPKVLTYAPVGPDYFDYPDLSRCSALRAIHISVNNKQSCMTVWQDYLDDAVSLVGMLPRAAPLSQISIKILKRFVDDPSKEQMAVVSLPCWRRLGDLVEQFSSLKKVVIAVELKTRTRTIMPLSLRQSMQESLHLPHGCELVFDFQCSPW
ncbi:hypothetical protein EIP91_010275 [Steccherinum ochraceum]|uniref:Uncharacterized protein n=1 Tax=Steccherinum ochraceum TaxID=92696 RepID=A0A4R0RJ30_9APHY|nr:hypothetical protein EIP91_010275 [Steccherinum ochraceum]